MDEGIKFDSLTSRKPTKLSSLLLHPYSIINSRPFIFICDLKLSNQSFPLTQSTSEFVAIVNIVGGNPPDDVLLYKSNHIPPLAI